MSKLSAVQNKAIEEYWLNIDQYRQDLKYREWELLENKKQDENIGGGKSNRISDTTANKAMILTNDERYQHLKKIIQAVEGTYETLNNEMKEFVDIRYFSEEAHYIDWEDVAEEMNITKPKAFKLRNKLVDKTAKKIGWL